MIDLREVIYHWQKGQNITQISRSLGISRPTVRKYVNVAKKAGLTTAPDAPMTDVLAEVAKAATPPLSPVAGEVQQSIALYKQNIQAWLSEPDMTAKQVWRLLKAFGNGFSYTSVKRYVKKVNPDTSRSSTVRLETPPAEQAQVDFGRVTLTFGETRKKVWAFVMTLSYSRHRFVRLVERQDIQNWLDCHIRAFEFYRWAIWFRWLL